MCPRVRGDARGRDGGVDRIRDTAVGSGVGQYAIIHWPPSRADEASGFESAKWAKTDIEPTSRMTESDLLQKAKRMDRRYSSARATPVRDH
jgi:hypothetical protein